MLPADDRCRQFHIRNLDVRHVCGDPRSRSAMQRQVDISKFKAAIVVCGERDAVAGQPPTLEPRVPHHRRASCCAVCCQTDNLLDTCFSIPPADSLWAEGGQEGGPDTDRGLHLLSQAEMLTLDAAMLMVQLNIRLLLEVCHRGYPPQFCHGALACCNP